MPYSDSTTTSASVRRAASISSPQTSSTAATSRAMAGSRRPEALQVVVEVRQVDERQRRPLLPEDAQRAATDPARRLDVGGRPPEAEQRKLAELAVELVAQAGRLRVDVGQLAAVGRVHRARRHRPVGRRVHVVPPEQLGAGERRVAPLRRLPHLLAVHQPVRLPPQPHLGQVAEIPAVGDDAVLARQRAGEQGRLHGGRHRRRHRRQRPQPATGGQRAQVRRMLQQRRRQADHVEHQRAPHAAPPRSHPASPAATCRAGP